MKLLALSSLIPEYIYDFVTFDGYDGERNIANYCAYAEDYISQLNSDVSIDGGVFPKSCDSTRVIKSYLADNGKLAYQLHIPVGNDSNAANFFADSIKELFELIKVKSGEDIDLESRCRLINERNAKLKVVYDMIGEYSYADYMNKLKQMLSLPLSEQKLPNDIAKQANSEGKKVFLIGSTPTDLSVFTIIENSGLKVVGDSFPNSGRLVSRPMVDVHGDLFEEIAKAMLSGRPSPTQDDFNSLVDTDIEKIMESGAEGVIFITQKYCEPYDYLYTTYLNELEGKGIKVIKINLLNSTNNNGLELAIEAFAESL